jgi:hypothetical protein
MAKRKRKSTFLTFLSVTVTIWAVVAPILGIATTLGLWRRLNEVDANATIIHVETVPMGSNFPPPGILSDK